MPCAHGPSDAHDQAAQASITHTGRPADAHEPAAAGQRTRAAHTPSHTHTPPQEPHRSASTQGQQGANVHDQFTRLAVRSSTSKLRTRR
eukprot:2705296-Prymnesium_polylepis.1